MEPWFRQRLQQKNGLLEKEQEFKHSQRSAGKEQRSPEEQEQEQERRVSPHLTRCLSLSSHGSAEELLTGCTLAAR